MNVFNSGDIGRRLSRSELCCQWKIFESDIYPVGITSLNSNNLIDNSPKLQDNKWTFYQSQTNDNFDVNLLCSTSKCGLKKSILPSVIITTTHTRHKSMDGICQPEFKQLQESDRGNLFADVRQGCKCSSKFKTM